jgi:hypothetical protein
MTSIARPCVFLFAALVASTSPVRAQPTYKLDVKPELRPKASLALNANQLLRTDLLDDPGFRLQYHFKKDGKTVEAVEARSTPVFALAHKEAGAYTVVLELFHPAYKGGMDQKGAYRPVSNVLLYRFEPGNPAKVTLLDDGKPRLVVQCGKGEGKKQDEVVATGYGYQLTQGTPFDGWPAPAAKTSCWTDAKAVTFALQVPSGTAGTLTLLFVDGDNKGRKQKLVVAGKPVADVEAFGGAGKPATVPISTEDAKTGKIEVMVQNLNPMTTAAVSLVEFTPAPPAVK